MKTIMFLALVVGIPLLAQQTDSTIVFESPNKNLASVPKTISLNAWGVDILLSNNGFGLAGFYRREYSRELSGTITLGIADSKDDNEVELVDYYTGQSIVIGKINRFLVFPLMFGVQYRLFAEDIADNFRPYINAGIGPTLVLAAPYEREWFSSWSYARSYYSGGGFIGLGAYFGNDMGSLNGINIRYYFIPYKNGIISLQAPSGQIGRKTDFGGFFITLNLGSMF